MAWFSRHVRWPDGRAGLGPGWLTPLPAPQWGRSAQPGLAVGGQARPLFTAPTWRPPPGPSLPPSFSYLQTHLQLTFLARGTESLTSAPHAAATTLVGPTTASLRPALHRLCPRHHLKYPRTCRPLLKTSPRLPPHSGTHSPWGLATPSLSLPALPLEPPLQPHSDREAQLPATRARCRPASPSACARATAVSWCPGEWLRAGSRAPAPLRRPRRGPPLGPRLGGGQGMPEALGGGSAYGTTPSRSLPCPDVLVHPRPGRRNWAPEACSHLWANSLPATQS